MTKAFRRSPATRTDVAPFPSGSERFAVFDIDLARRLPNSLAMRQRRRFGSSEGSMEVERPPFRLMSAASLNV